MLSFIQGIGGLKTGYTENAGENLVSMYRSNGHEYIIVIVKSQDRFADTRNIVKWINDNVTFISI
jgi:D-alanyl-D-alanine carboxypeptidase